MTFLVSGLIVFFLMHLLPSTSLKISLVSNVGEVPYKIGFSLVSLTGLGLIIYGYSLSSFEALWLPPAWGSMILMLVMPIVCILWVAAEVPNNIKRFIRHPMLTAMIIWGVGHLIANGDLASSLIFASFTIFSIVNILLVNKRSEFKPHDSVSKIWDLGVVIGGLLVYGLIFYFHGTITGMPLY
ncbi:MAG: NnrU family protein [Pseudomonadales bacterium]|nr:NnrU family protein [Pseudomonadales bacterium]